MRIILLGPPGAGKGTQAAAITAAYGIPHISTGDLFRASYHRGETLGIEAHDCISRGELVPDRVAIALVENRLSEEDCRKGWLLDGFPRTREQAVALDEFLESRGEQPDTVLLISLEAEEIVNRLANRRVCRSCGATYHLTFRPPAKEGRCDACGGKLFARADDNPETIRKRLAVYEAETQPLVEFFEQKGMLESIDGNQDIEGVTEAAKASLVGLTR